MIKFNNQVNFVTMAIPEPEKIYDKIHNIDKDVMGEINSADDVKNKIIIGDYILLIYEDKITIQKR